MSVNTEAVKLAAELQFRKELFNERVQAELALLREQHNRSLWRRILAALPFTITFHWKTK